MRLPKVWIVAVGLLGVLPLALVAQETGPRLETPSSAVVTAGSSPRVAPGQVFLFQLRLNVAPEGYGGGEIDYTSQIGQPPRPLGFPYEQTSFNGKADLHDGQAIYTLSVPIVESMLPGTWKLASVRLGKAVMSPIAVPDNVAFQIPDLPPVVIRLEAPSSVIASQRLVFKVILEQPPSGLDPQCVVALGVSLRQGLPNGQPSPGGYSVRVGNVDLDSGRGSYEASGSLAPDAPDGQWQGSVNIYAQPRPPALRRF
jgi:hypothetical protein